MTAREYFARLRWKILISLAVIHIAAIVGFYAYSFEGLLCFGALYFVTGTGVTAGYHRMLTHGAFEAWRPVRWLLTLAGMASGQGAPLEWVAVHRKHHEHSDTEEDPHSPHHGGFLWSHITWLWSPLSRGAKTALYKRYARDLLADPFLRFVSQGWVYVLWLLLTAVVIGLCGYVVGGWELCVSFLAYGVFIRLVAVYHVTWFVNSATHLWGYRGHETDDRSRNLWWVAILANGEGWHNNHHAHQRVANHGQRWWEFDGTYLIIRILALFGFAWNVAVYNTATQKVEVRYKR